MRLRTGIRIAVVASVAAVLIWSFGWYDAYFIAEKACLRAHVGASAEQAGAHLREIAAMRSAKVLESGERTTAIFRYMSSDVSACTFVARDGKIIEQEFGARALKAVR